MSEDEQYLNLLTIPTDEEYEREPVPVNEEEAEDELRIAKHWARQVEKWKDITASEIARVQTRCNAEISKAENRQRWHQLRLEGLLKASAKRKLSFANGSVQWRKAPVRIDVTDPEKLLEWASQQPLDIADEVAPRRVFKAELNKYVKTTGEEPPGVVTYRPPDSLWVRFTK